MIYAYLKNKMKKSLNNIICDESESISYRDLLTYAESFGNELKNYKEHKFGILCRSNLNTAKVLMACFFAKKTAVLLSYRYGEKHNQKIIENIGLTHIITDNDIEVSKDAEKFSETEDLTDVALIMCTSGTTGNPKGAMITYENLITNLKDISIYFKLYPHQKILIARPLYHCAVLTGEFLLSLVKGLNIIFQDGSFNPVNIIRTVRQHNVSVLCGTPTMFYHIFTAAKKTSVLPIETIAVSGECMTLHTAECIRSVFPNVNVYNVYGLTEASPRVSYLPPELFDKYPLSVGFPLSSLKVKIKDGELLVKGKSIMKAYYNNPDATKRTIKNGWLHTGDIAEMNELGMIIIKSRKDDMIIRAGMNIYPQEIENTLKQDARIIEALVYGSKNDTAGQKICLMIVGNNLTKQEIFVLCKELLPLYQLPDTIEIVDEIPKNASGKVIRKIPK